MLWSSVISEKTNSETALNECCRQLLDELKSPPDLLFLFLSPHHSRSYNQIPEKIQRASGAKVLIGCSAGGAIGGKKEIEQKPALALTGALLPEVEIHPFHLKNEELPDMDASPKSWHEVLKIFPEKNPAFISFPDPFSLDTDQFVTGLDYAYSKSIKVGGLASGAHRPKENALFFNDTLHHEGVVGVALSGNVRVEAVVAQGCRPIGTPHIITACEKNVLLELDHQPPLKIVQNYFENCSERDRRLMQTSLFLGFAMIPTPAFLPTTKSGDTQRGEESKTNFQQGDFLIRNIIGLNSENGWLAIGAELREGQTVQFHLRDAETSHEDLEEMLSGYCSQKNFTPPAGSLLFSCMGRGIYLYGTPNHDSRVFFEKVGNVPLGGFFCNGEIGPVNETTYLHGYTSCFALFKPKKS